MRGETPGTLFGTNEVRRFEVRGTGKEFVPHQVSVIDDVPAADRKRLRETYKTQTGAMLPDRKLIDLYNKERGNK
jgi:hypothetical protein